MTKVLSLLKYMKMHNKNNPTFFDLKELSNHLGLNENETFKIIKKVKKLGYIKSSAGLVSDNKIIHSKYYITKLGIDVVKNNFKNKFNVFLELSIFKFLALVTILYGIYEIVIRLLGK